MKRCFAFGCSFTGWFMWPTWADFIGINFDEFHNFGHPGTSNRNTLNRFIEVDRAVKFTENDLVLIGITNFGRFNFLRDINKKPSWFAHGAPQNWPNFPDNQPLNKTLKFLKEEFWDQRWGIYETFIMVNGIKQLLERVGCEYKFIMALDNNLFLEKEFFNLIDADLEMSKEIFSAVVNDKTLQTYSQNYHLPVKYDHGHPIPQAHFDFAKEYFPNLITDRSKTLLDDILKEFNCDDNSIQCGNFYTTMAKYSSYRSDLKNSLYGSYH